jgi:hypothetical protein
MVADIPPSSFQTIKRWDYQGVACQIATLPSLGIPALRSVLMQNSSEFPNRPELLAPAGDLDCVRAAIENGADAVYFGLQGHNARARATNFELDSLPELMHRLHHRGVKGYVTLNTLVFPASWRRSSGSFVLWRWPGRMRSSYRIWR